MTAGVVAAGHDLTVQAGVRVLADGGNAVDAAVAAVAMACVCEPVLCSPGGGAFAMVRDGSDGRVQVLDAFVQTPRRREPTVSDGVRDVWADFGTTRQSFRIGPATTATPGLFDGLVALAGSHGSATLSELVADAADAARDGVTVTPFQSYLFGVVEPILTATAGVRSLFAPGGQLLATGARFRNPGLADALESLAARGVAASEVGSSMVEQQRGRGHLSDQDLSQYEVIWRAPIAIELGSDTVHLNPQPAAGGVLVAHTLERLVDVSAETFAAAIAATAADRVTAAGNLALLQPDRVRRRGTTHVSVVDEHGNACSITASNGEGNGELVDGFGFMLNNILGEDDVNPDGSDWPTDVRLSSMMCPTIVEHGDGRLTALGSGGSSRIRTAVSRVLGRLCLGGDTVAQAVDAPRLHVEDGHLDLEPGLGDATVDVLTSRFHDHRRWPDPSLYFGGVHVAQRRPDGSFVGIGDPRRSGAAQRCG